MNWDRGPRKDGLRAEGHLKGFSKEPFVRAQGIIGKASCPEVPEKAEHVR